MLCPINSWCSSFRHNSETGVLNEAENLPNLVARNQSKKPMDRVFGVYRYRETEDERRLSETQRGSWKSAGLPDRSAGMETTGTSGS